MLSLGGASRVQLGGVEPLPGYAVDAIAILAIAWVTNLYNFMDGIDGLAAVEAIFVGAAGAIILSLGHAGGLALLSASLAGAGAGFLIWNRMPARIFMGDVGSGFLGFVFASIAIAAHVTAGVPAALWVILLLVFIGDATLTLFRRIAHGDPWHTAHRLHAYQRLVQSGLTHARVTRTVAAVNLVLAGFAIIAYLDQRLLWPLLLVGIVGVCAAYAAVERRKQMWSPLNDP